MQQEPRSVLVVGGGTAGWLAASYLAATVGKTRGVTITLVESPDIGVIGVGEATIPTLRRTISELGIPEDEFLKGVNGAVKQAIRFQDWARDPAQGRTHFYHPFHKASEADIHAATQYLYFNPDAPLDAYASLATAQTLACESNKAPHADDSKQGFIYAYHIDAILFGRFLRSRFEGKGVTRVEGEVRQVSRGADGDIEAVILGSGQRLEADLYVDCSGFRGLLINGALEVPFQSFRDWLPCDRAVAISVPYLPGERIRPYTVSTAQKAGWIWDINLASRRGVGHVFSTAHMSDDQAVEGLRAYLGRSWPQGGEPRFIQMRVGRNQRLWERNCVAIGLAGGFVEPLESTGIYLIESGVRYLIDYWPTSGPSEAARWGYNRLMADAYDEVVQFVLMHYVTSGRRDSDFWRDITRPRPLPGDLHLHLEAWRHKYPSLYDAKSMSGSVFGYESYIAILAGMGWFKGIPSPFVMPDEAGLRRHLLQRRLALEAQVGSLPSRNGWQGSTAGRADVPRSSPLASGQRSP